jgi:hypothetical protein
MRWRHGFRVCSGKQRQVNHAKRKRTERENIASVLLVDVVQLVDAAPPSPVFGGCVRAHGAAAQGGRHRRGFDDVQARGNNRARITKLPTPFSCRTKKFAQIITLVAIIIITTGSISQCNS